MEKTDKRYEECLKPVRIVGQIAREMAKLPDSVDGQLLTQRYIVPVTKAIHDATFELALFCSSLKSEIDDLERGLSAVENRRVDVCGSHDKTDSGNDVDLATAAQQLADDVERRSVDLAARLLRDDVPGFRSAKLGGSLLVRVRALVSHLRNDYQLPTS